MRCEHCQFEFVIEDEHFVGKDVKCPNCGKHNRCSTRRVLLLCPECKRELECEVWMLGGFAECSFCGKNIKLTRPTALESSVPNPYLPPGYQLGNYKIRYCLGAGGMGEVYLVHHTLLDRECALKLIRPQGEGGVDTPAFEQLIHEARLACRLQSPHIISVMDVQIDPQRGFGYIVMEYVRGNDLENMLGDEPMSEDMVLDIARQVAMALVEAAKFNIVHRDIKPANIMVTDEGVVKLADMGIAKSSNDTPSVDSGNRITGTVHYASPEQLFDSNKVDARADIYSLGATMYTLLSGLRPFDGPSAMSVVAQVIRGDCKRLESVAPQVSPATCRLVGDMMALAPDRRPQDAAALLKRINQIIRVRSGKVPLWQKLLPADGLKDLPIPEKIRALFPGGKLSRPARTAAVTAGCVLLAVLLIWSLLPSGFSAGKKKPAAPKTAVQAAAPRTAEKPPAQQPARQAAEEPKAAPAAKAAETRPAAPAVPGDHVDFIRLLILVAWILSGLKTISYLGAKRNRSAYVERYFDVLQCVSLIAGPVVWLIVELNMTLGRKLQKIKDKAQNLPDIVDNQGNPAFNDTSGEDSDIVFQVRSLLGQALTLHASDIFIDPKTGGTSIIRFRVDGALRTMKEIDSELGSKLINVLKVASGMNISERRRPQDGSFSLSGCFGEVSLRTATVGALSGEKIALRILGDDSGPKNLAEAGISGRELAMLENAIRLPSGMVLICGPTGSGKTTTLYAMLNSIDYSIKNVISIEDPIEHIIPAVSQMEVNEPAGITFAQLLRNALRQNPDIICVGEIRDEDTASVAVHAAQTGHLIIATLHSNGNISTIDRLANLHIPLRSIAGTLRLVISQRLVRKLCSCKKKCTPTPEERQLLGNAGAECDTIYAPKGCPKCGDTGYSGRTALFDILPINDELRTLLEDEHTNLNNIQRQLEKATHGNVMARAGYALVAKGITSIAEVQRVTMDLKD